MRALFRTVGMDPDHALIRYGRGDQAFAISPQVFEPDEHGRSYRFRPSTRSVWLRQITIQKGPFMMFQVLDTPQHRAAAARAGAIVDEGSIQNTNSWGLRGAEPDPQAEVRGIVLGDSFMQAMFNGDGDTPPVHLERDLQRRLEAVGLDPQHRAYRLLAGTVLLLAPRVRRAISTPLRGGERLPQRFRRRPGGDARRGRLDGRRLHTGWARSSNGAGPTSRSA